MYTRKKNLYVKKITTRELIKHTCKKEGECYRAGSTVSIYFVSLAE